MSRVRDVGRLLTAALALTTRKLNRVQRRRPRLFFDPSPALWAFVRDTARRICVLAANRVGKTITAIYKLALAMVSRPGIRCRIVGPTSKRVNRVHGRYLWDFVRDVVAPGCTWNEATGFNGGNLCRLRNGSTCEILSYEQDPQAHASDSMDIVLLDEPPPPAHFTEAEARVFDRSGAVWVTLTAVGRPVKWLKEVVEQGIAEREAGEGEGWSFYQIALTAENCPWYTPAQIRRRIREVARTPWEYAQRIEGAWDGISEERRFASFTDQNVVPLTVRPTEGWPLPGERIHAALAVDHGEGPGHSHWLLFGWQVAKRSQYGVDLVVRVLAEWTNPRRMSAAKEAKAVKAMVEAAGVKLHDLDFAVGDTNTAAKSAGARTLNELFELEFAKLMKRPADNPRLRFRPAKKGPDSINAGLAICNQLFDEEIGADDPVRSLQISEGCKRLVESCSHWQGKDDELKHAADCLRYGVTAIVDETGWEPARLMAA